MMTTSLHTVPRRSTADLIGVLIVMSGAIVVSAQDQPERPNKMKAGVLDARVTTTTIPGHKVQVWELLDSRFYTYFKLSMQHGAAGRDGAFYLTVWTDNNGNAIPHREIMRSVLCTADNAGDWSSVVFETEPGMRLFVGSCWNRNSVRIFYETEKEPAGYQGLGGRVYFTREFGHVPDYPRENRFANIVVHCRKEKPERDPGKPRPQGTVPTVTREWTSNRGKAVIARFMRFTGQDKIVLRRVDDGCEISVPIVGLSQDDQAHLQVIRDGIKEAKEKEDRPPAKTARTVRDLDNHWIEDMALSAGALPEGTGEKPIEPGPAPTVASAKNAGGAPWGLLVWGPVILLVFLTYLAFKSSLSENKKAVGAMAGILAVLLGTGLLLQVNVVTPTNQARLFKDSLDVFGATEFAIPRRNPTAKDNPHLTGKVVVIIPQRVEEDMNSKKIHPALMHPAWRKLDTSIRATFPEEVSTVIHVIQQRREGRIYASGLDQRFVASHVVHLDIYDWVTKKYTGRVTLDPGDFTGDVMSKDALKQMEKATNVSAIAKAIEALPRQ